MMDYFELTTQELENLVSKRMHDLGVNDEDYFKIANSLHLLKIHDLASYDHSLRVGLMAAEIGENIRLRPKPLFLAGILHDIGKICVKENTLNREKFDYDDYEETKIHTLAGYRLLEKDFPFSANVLIRHHTHGPDPYPKILPKSSVDFSEETIKEINYFSRFLALIDFYDAISTRQFDKYEKELDKNEKKNILFAKNRDIESLVEELYKEEIFV